MREATLVLLALGGVTAGCLYTPDANGHATVPEGITSIGDSAFEGCRALVSIGLPSSLTSIGKSSFKDCPFLTSLTLPSNVTSIGDEAFRGCLRLVSIALSDSLSTIGMQAFAYCGALGSIALPDDVSSIGRWAFHYCSSLALVHVPVGCEVGPQAFDQTAASPGYVHGHSEANIGDGPQDKTLGLAIGLPLGGLFLAALAAILIWMRRKRRMKQPEAGQDSEVTLTKIKSVDV